MIPMPDSSIEGFLSAILSKRQGGGSPPAPSPLSLEGIKALKTLATVTVGDFVWEIKEPKIFYAGQVIDYTTYQQIQYWWWSSAVLNGVIAKIGDYSSCNFFRYGTFTDIDGNVHSKYTYKMSNFGISDPSQIRHTLNQKYGFAKLSVRYDFVYEDGYDDILQSHNSSADMYIDLTYNPSPCFTSLSEDEYLNMAKSYYGTATANTPNIKIL